MRRFEMSEAQYARLAPHLPGKASDPGFTAQDNYLFIQGVLWILRTGAPWRDLPERYGKWNSIFRRFRRWSEQGTWKKLFEKMQDPDFEWLLMDATIIRVHQDAAGSPAGKAAEDIGRSRGGNTTKIHAAVDGLGNPVRLLISEGQAADITYAPPLLNGLRPEVVIADKAYDSDEFVATIEAVPAEACIPPTSNRIVQRVYDKFLYRFRNLVERFFNQLKQLRRVATRYEKTTSSYAGMVHLGSLMILMQ